MYLFARLSLLLALCMLPVSADSIGQQVQLRLSKASSRSTHLRGARQNELFRRTLLIEARVACATIRSPHVPDYNRCIEDIMINADLGMADEWPHSEEDSLDKKALLLEQGRIACASVLGSDFTLCVQDVIGIGDVGRAKLWTEST